MIRIYTEFKDVLILIRNYKIIILLFKIYFFQIFLIMVFMEAFKIVEQSKQIQSQETLSSKEKI
jgi:hypothetical protein